MLSYHIPDKLRIRKSKKHLKIDENIENWRNNSKIKLKIVISIISERILTEKWNFRNFRWGVEDDSRVSIVNDVNNCSSSTKSSRRDAPLPLFRATDISRNGSLICSMSKFIVSFHHPYAENVQIRIVNSSSGPVTVIIRCTNG